MRTSKGGNDPVTEFFDPRDFGYSGDFDDFEDLGEFGDIDGFGDFGDDSVAENGIAEILEAIVEAGLCLHRRWNIHNNRVVNGSITELRLYPVLSICLQLKLRYLKIPIFR